VHVRRHGRGRVGGNRGRLGPCLTVYWVPSYERLIPSDLSSSAFRQPRESSRSQSLPRTADGLGTSAETTTDAQRRGYRRFRPNNPSKVGKAPRDVCRMTRAAGEERPALAFARCLMRDGFVQASTCEMPRDRLTRRLADVYPVSCLMLGRR
jgi:hypothetical protein